MWAMRFNDPFVVIARLGAVPNMVIPIVRIVDAVTGMHGAPGNGDPKHKSRRETKVTDIFL